MLDYLLKPVTKERLQKTLQRISNRKEQRNSYYSSKLRVSCFGKFKVESEKSVSVKWRTSKTEELFAFLVDKNGKETSKEVIVDVLWGHMEEKKAFTNFSTCLYYLRKTLVGLGFPNLVINNARTVSLDMSQISTDVQEFEKYISDMKQKKSINLSKFRKFLENY